MVIIFIIIYWDILFIFYILEIYFISGLCLIEVLNMKVLPIEPTADQWNHNCQGSIVQETKKYIA